MEYSEVIEMFNKMPKLAQKELKPILDINDVDNATKYAVFNACYIGYLIGQAEVREEINSINK